MLLLRKLAFVLLAFVPLLSPAAIAQFGIPTQVQRGIQSADIRERVSQYCRLDYLGARLTGPDWTKLKPVVSWSANPEFPLINVVSRYDVDSNVQSDHGKWFVTVHYHLLGRFNVGEGYSKEVAGTVEDVGFAVDDLNGELKVVDINPNYPHPSRATMLQWLQAEEAKTADPKVKVIYEQSIKELSAQSGSPFAK